MTEDDPGRTVPRPSETPAATVVKPTSDTGPSATGQPVIRYFGDYELLEEVARGGMGVVFRARQVSLNRPVAVKMIPSGGLAGPAEVQRFRLEAEAAANLDHPNVLPIYEVGEHEGQPYFSMKLVAGGSLADRLRPADPGRFRDTLQPVVRVCQAVHFAHQRGVLHRDLKPANVLLDADGTPYVTDFGIAKRAGGEDARLTQTGVAVGSPSYMPPEQARGENGVTVAADVYSLGAILYEVLTGRPPFREPTVMATLMRVMNDPPADPRAVNPKADPDLALVALKCLEKDPGKRYESAAALADELDRWLAGEPLTVRPLSQAAQAWRWVRRNAGAIARTAGVGAFVGLGFGVASALLPAWLRGEAAILGVYLVISGVGWFTVAGTRPDDRTTALAAGLLAGLSAGMLSLALAGELSVVGSGAYATRPALRLTGAVHRTEVADGLTRGAFSGTRSGFISTVLVFAAFGVCATWAADHHKRSHRPLLRTILAYGELMIVGAALVVFFILSDMDRPYSNRPVGGAIDGWSVMIAAILLMLVAAVPGGVLSGWQWWWRLLVYTGWPLVTICFSRLLF